MRKVGDLSALHQKYYSRGFRVVAVSSESQAALASKVLEQRGGTYWIGSDPNQETMRNYASEGSLGIPRFYLVDARGEVVGHDVPSEDQLETLLDEVFMPELDRELHAELAAAERSYRSGAYGVAWAAAGKLSDAKDAAVASDAQYLRAKIEKFASHTKRQIEFEWKSKRPASNCGSLLLLRHQFDGLQVTKWADGELKKLQRDDEVRRDKKVWKNFEAALKREMKAGGKPYELKRARQMYEKARKGNSRTVPGRLAAKRLERLDTAR